MEEKDGRGRRREHRTRLSVARRAQVAVAVPAGDLSNFNVVVGSDYRDDHDEMHERRWRGLLF